MSNRVSRISAGIKPELRARKRRADPEHKIQAAIVRFHRYAVDSADAILFSVPNGGKRGKVTAAKMHAEGALPGASDLILVTKDAVDFLEVKIPSGPGIRAGTQSKEQLQFEQNVLRLGHPYTVIRSIDDYKDILAKRGVPVRAW